MEPFRPRVEGKHISLYFNIDEAVPLDVAGDPTRLRQILINLIANGIKFTHEGNVGLEVNVERALGDHHSIIRFTIKDTGVGIPQEKQDVIFEAFSQADMSTTREYGGTGLGLAICRAYVDAVHWG